MIWYQQIVEDLYFGQTGAGFGMRILALVLFCLTVLLGAGTAAAGEGSTAGACPVAEQPLNLKFDEANTWTACEKWVWSCIVQGQEANLFVRKCVEPRSRDNENLRKTWLDRIFEDPSQFQASNALSGRFLLKILWLPFYADQIPPPGIRIFGGYFAEHVKGQP